VLDFRTVKDLADYLRYLAENATAYNEYFKWKEFISVNTQPRIDTFVPFCDMCIYMNLERFYGIQPKVLADIGAFHGRRHNCKEASVDDSQYKLNSLSIFSWF
jgi:hypothetical protein